MPSLRASFALAAAIVAGLVLWNAPARASDGLPQLDRARSGPCVEDPALMRKRHMEILVHGRDETVRRGIRDRSESLARCVDCHASREDGRVIGSDRHFCQGCHTYAAVRIDCFDCHASRAGAGLAQAAAKESR